MIKSIYTPLSGALAQEKVMDIIANNLANVNTVGFKEESVTFKLMEPEPEKNYKSPLPPANYKISLDEILPLKGNEMSYVGVSGVHRDLSQGSAIETKNPLNIMIEGDGLIALNTKNGVRYTRNGQLNLSADGALVSGLGDPVLGQRGNIYLNDQDIQINRLGEIYQNGELVDKLKIFTVSNAGDLEKVGGNQYFYSGSEKNIGEVEFPSIKQGYLEGSNVNPVKNLTAMILAHRSYEAYQKAIKNYDTMMDKSSNSIGEVRG